MKSEQSLYKFRQSHIRNREMTTIAVLTALAFISRICFYMLPEVKPMAAIVIITAICYGKFPAFLVGALTMLTSNFAYGQGPWTVYQMLGMGMVGVFAGLFLKNQDFESKKSVILTALAGGLITFAVYGFIVDTGTIFFFQNGITIANAIAIYTAGAFFNMIHAVGTVAFILLIGKPIFKKLKRIKVKYGIFY